MDWRTSAVKKISKYWGVIAIAVLCIVGVSLILYFTRTSPGVSGDSVWYVMGAENMLAGDGYSRTSGGGEIKPIVGFPPFFSMVLAECFPRLETHSSIYWVEVGFISWRGLVLRKLIAS